MDPFLGWVPTMEFGSLVKHEEFAVDDDVMPSGLPAQREEMMSESELGSDNIHLSADMMASGSPMGSRAASLKFRKSGGDLSQHGSFTGNPLEAMSETVFDAVIAQVEHNVKSLKFKVVDMLGAGSSANDKLGMHEELTTSIDGALAKGSPPPLVATRIDAAFQYAFQEIVLLYNALSKRPFSTKAYEQAMSHHLKEFREAKRSIELLKKKCNVLEAEMHSARADALKRRKELAENTKLYLTELSILRSRHQELMTKFGVEGQPLCLLDGQEASDENVTTKKTQEEEHAEFMIAKQAQEIALLRKTVTERSAFVTSLQIELATVKTTHHELQEDLRKVLKEHEELVKANKKTASQAQQSQQRSSIGSLTQSMLGRSAIDPPTASPRSPTSPRKKVLGRGATRFANLVQQTMDSPRKDRESLADLAAARRKIAALETSSAETAEELKRAQSELRLFRTGKKVGIVPDELSESGSMVGSPTASFELVKKKNAALEKEIAILKDELETTKQRLRAKGSTKTLLKGASEATLVVPGDDGASIVESSASSRPSQETPVVQNETSEPLPDLHPLASTMAGPAEPATPDLGCSTQVPSMPSNTPSLLGDEPDIVPTEVSGTASSASSRANSNETPRSESTASASTRAVEMADASTQADVPTPCEIEVQCDLAVRPATTDQCVGWEEADEEEEEEMEPSEDYEEEGENTQERLDTVRSGSKKPVFSRTTAAAAALASALQNPGSREEWSQSPRGKYNSNDYANYKMMVEDSLSKYGAIKKVHDDMLNDFKAYTRKHARCNVTAAEETAAALRQAKGKQMSGNAQFQTASAGSGGAAAKAHKIYSVLGTEFQARNLGPELFDELERRAEQRLEVCVLEEFPGLEHALPLYDLFEMFIILRFQFIQLLIVCARDAERGISDGHDVSRQRDLLRDKFTSFRAIEQYTTMLQQKLKRQKEDILRNREENLEKLLSVMQNLSDTHPKEIGGLMKFMTLEQNKRPSSASPTLNHSAPVRGGKSPTQHPPTEPRATTPNPNAKFFRTTPPAPDIEGVRGVQSKLRAKRLNLPKMHS